MNLDLTLGIDLGTTKVAAVIVDPKTAKLLAAGSESHDAALDAGPDGAEESVEKIMATLWRILEVLPAELKSRVGAIGATGQMHSVTGWNAAGNLYPLITWQDKRCGAAGLLDDFCRQSGRTLRDGFGGATLARLARANRLNECVGVSTIMDYAVMQLCANPAPVTDPTDAASWGLYDVQTGDWDQKALAALNIPAAIMPKIVPTGSQAGMLHAALAEKLGLPAGIPVFCALGDNQASILGTGGNFEEELYLTLGTGAQLSVAVPKAQVEKTAFPENTLVEARPFLGDRVLLVAAPLCGGRAFAWLGDLVTNVLASCGCPVPDGKKLLDHVDALGVATLKNGEPSVKIDPSFLGERNAPQKRGEITGLTLDNADLGSWAAAMALGIVRNLKAPFPAELFAGRKRVVGSGNGVRKVNSVQEAIRREFHLPLVLSDAKEEAACGAALLAARSGRGEAGGEEKTF